MSKKANRNKATNKGTCQVCGCIQKLPSSRLSTHGYTVQWGFFSGICHGSEGKPLEESCDLIEHSILRANQQAEAVRARQAELNTPVPAGTTKAWVSLYFPAMARGEKSHSRYVEVEIYSKEHNYTDCTPWTAYYYTADPKRRAMDTGEHNRSIGARGTMEEHINRKNQQYASSMDEQLAEIAKYVRWQEKRVKEWAPKPLLPL